MFEQDNILIKAADHQDVCTTQPSEHSVRCIHAVIVKFTNIEVGILKMRPRTLDFFKTPT